MKKYLKHIIVALVSFLFIVFLNFFLPRLLPGDTIGYLTGIDEANMSTEKYNYYYHALHLDENIFVQFGYYLKSLFDGTLGYSYKKEMNVSTLIGERILPTLLICIPALIISYLISITLGIKSGLKENSILDKTMSITSIILNSIPGFVITLIIIIVFSLNSKLFPNNGLVSGEYSPTSFYYYLDLIYHLVLPVLCLVLILTPARFLLIRNLSSSIKDSKTISFATQRGLSTATIEYKYVLPNIISPIITNIGLSIGIIFGSTIIIENIFSINGIGKLLNEAIYNLDYPLMQGLLFVTSLVMTLAVIISDILCILINPKIRKKI